MKAFSDNLIRDVRIYKKSFFPIFPIIKCIGTVEDAKDSNYDLGWIEIEKEQAFDCIALQLNEIYLSAIEIDTDGAILTGFPRDLIDINKFEEKKETALRFLIYQTCFTIGASENQMRTGHLLLDYPLTGIDNMRGGIRKMPTPKGCSGGGIWVARKQSEKVWNIANRVKLIGIDIEWIENERTVKATRLIHLLEYLKKMYPDLIDIIDKRLALN